ncbi:MAG: AgmX/PglI C-terminal domain-containing protein [Alphaproteobacteria bacterium]|nr:AgmX/PglI C-terminal domain-containing protein [Alphaproteobacteria bacterium]
MRRTDDRRSKSLRVATIEDGSRMRERIFRPGTSVTLGSDRGCSLRIDPTPVTGACFELFQAGADGFELRFTDAFGPRSRLREDRGTVRLADLVEDVRVRREGDVWVLPIDASTRGRLQIGRTTVLFQLVAQPVVTAGPTVQHDFRPHLVEPEDGVFLLNLGWMSAAAVAFGLAVWATPPPTYDVEDLTERVAELSLRPAVVLPPPPEVVAVVEVPRAPRTPVERAPVQQPEPDTTPGAAGPSGAPGRGRPLGIGLIGTAGDGDVVAATWEGSDAGTIDLTGVGAVTTDPTDGSGTGLRGGTDAPAAASIASIGTMGGGRSGIGGTPDLVASLEVEEGTAEALVGDTSMLKAHVRRRAGQMKYCFERELKRVGELGGRVEIGWTMDAGTVGDVWVVHNGTGSEDLARCMVDKVKRWSFPDALSGEVSWPFVFTVR